MNKYEEPIIIVVIIDDKDIVTSSGPEGYIEYWGVSNEE